MRSTSKARLAACARLHRSALCELIFPDVHAMAAALGYTCTPALPDRSEGDPVDAFMHQAAAQGKYVAAVADAMLVPAPSRNEVNRVARMAEDLIDTTTALLSVLRGRMRKAPGGES